MAKNCFELAYNLFSVLLMVLMVSSVQCGTLSPSCILQRFQGLTQKRLHTLHLSGHKIFTSKPPILISAQEVLLLFFCARNLCQTLSPWICSLVLPATQSPPFLINLGLTTFCLHCHGTCKGPTPPRSPADYFLPNVGCLPCSSSQNHSPLSFPSRTMRVICSIACVFCSVAKSQSRHGTKPSPWLEMVGRTGKKK